MSAEDVDRELDEIEDQLRFEEQGGGFLGFTHPGGTDTVVDTLARSPVQLVPRQPLVLDLRGKVGDLERNVTGKDRWPLLVCHGLTPFVNPGERSARVCALGYETRLVEATKGLTLTVLPDSAFAMIAKFDQRLSVVIDAQGSASLAAVPLGPFAEVGQVKVSAATSTQLQLGLEFVWSVLSVQSGPLADGGARWDLFQRREQLQRFQSLLQIVLVPEGARELVFEVRSWVRVSPRFFGKARHWDAPTQTFRHVLED